MLFDVSKIDSVKTINHNPMKYFQTMNRWNIDILGKSFAEALGHVWNFYWFEESGIFSKTAIVYITNLECIF